MNFFATLRKAGGSFIITIPKGISRHLDFKEGQLRNFDVEETQEIRNEDIPK